MYAAGRSGSGRTSRAGAIEYPTDEWDIRWYRRDAQSIAHRAATAYRDFAWRCERHARNSDVGWNEVRVPCRSATLRTLPGHLGNPSAPLPLNPEWLTSTVVQLAEGIYNDRAFDRLPILADALQDAGCEMKSSWATAAARGCTCGLLGDRSPARKGVTRDGSGMVGVRRPRTDAGVPAGQGS
jgi:hypothetical protein